MIGRVASKCHAGTVELLLIGNCRVASKEDIADKLAKSNNHGLICQEWWPAVSEAQVEKQKLNFGSDSAGSFSLPFAMEKLDL